MTQQFTQFIKANQLFRREERVLLAVSGGIDSVVMAHLFQRAGYQFGIAHCNFQLRGDDADQDALFVKHLADQLNVPFYTIAFETERLAEEQKKSIQLLARELRYDWLESIRQQNSYQYLATAHHLNDSVETVLYNFVKGTGIRGLSGIPIRNKKIIRPLLFTTSSEIQAFAQSHGIQWREDSSNASDKYARNLIRHQIIPVFQKLNPAFDKTAAQNIDRLKEIEFLYLDALERLKGLYVKEQNDQIQIDLHPINNHPAKATLLYEWLRPYGFMNDQIDQLLQPGKTVSGRQFYSTSHRLVTHRDLIIVEAIKESNRLNNTTFQLDNERNKVKTIDFTIELKLEDRPDKVPSSLKEAWLDTANIQFPITVRKWKAGDRFQPLGMNGQHQSVQDFLTNQKLSLFEKERVWVALSGDKIAWVIGHRISGAFKIVPSTRKCIHLSVYNK